MGSIARQPGLPVALAFAGIAPLMFYVMPMFLGALSREHHWPDTQLAHLVTAEYVGKTAGMLLVAALIGSVRWNRLALLGAALFVACNLASIPMDRFVTLAPVRVVAGFGSSILYALALVYIGRTATPERNFGYLLAIQTLLQSSLLWLSPSVISAGGVDGLLLMFALLAVPALFVTSFIRELPASASSVGAGAEAAWNAHLRSITTILAYLLFNMALGTGWTFIERIGDLNGIGTELIARILAIAMALSSVGGLVASALGLRKGRALPSVAGGALMVASMLLLLGHVTPLTFALAAGGFLFCWNFLGVYQLGLVAAADSTGRYVALAPVALTAGFGAGPFVSSFLLGDGQFTHTTWLAVVCLCLSTVLFLRAASRLPVPPPKAQVV